MPLKGHWWALGCSSPLNGLCMVCSPSGTGVRRACSSSAASLGEVGLPEVLGTTRALLHRARLPGTPANSCTGASNTHRHPPDSLTHRLQPQAARRRLRLPCCILLLLQAMCLPQHDRLQGAIGVTALKEDGADCVLQALLYPAVLGHLSPQRRHLQTGWGCASQAVHCLTVLCLRSTQHGHLQAGRVGVLQDTR